MKARGKMSLPFEVVYLNDNPNQKEEIHEFIEKTSFGINFKIIDKEPENPYWEVRPKNNSYCGLVSFPVGDWLAKNPNDSLIFIEDEDFRKTYEII